jgi:hypothetical protein
MSRRTDVLVALKWDFLLIALLACAVMVTAVLRSPFLRLADDPKMGGSRPPDRFEGDVLLLLPDVPSAEASSLDELDCSYAWFNMLWQEHGSFATAMTQSLSPELLAGRSVVVVPRRVAAAMPTTGISVLGGFVRQGGQLVLEQPTGSWSRLAGITISGKATPARQITSAEGLGVHGPMRKHLPNVPLAGQLLDHPPAQPWPQGPSLLDVDGHPGVMVQAFGEGRVYTLLFDLGCTSLALQQGRPTRGMRFGAADAPERGETSMRVAHERMRTSKVPYADLLERALLDQLSQLRPLPRLWPFPGTQAGAVILTHPTPQNMRAAVGFADWSHKQQGSATVFLAADLLDAEQEALLRAAHADVGLLWVRGQQREPVVRTLGVGLIRPLAQEFTLEEQARQLESQLLQPGALRLVRVERGGFDNHWSHTFGQLAHARVHLDMSLGPSAPGEVGYLFGTGFPYYPLDEQGLPLPVLEQPFVLHEGSLSPETLKSFLVNSQTYFHQPLAISLPSHAMRTQPSAGLMLALSQVHALAREHQHWVASAGEFLDFLAARRRSVLTSQWSATTRRLTITVNLQASSAMGFAQGATPGVAMPRMWRGEEIVRVVLDGQDVPLRKLATSGPGLDHILEVSPGRHTILVYYNNPAEASAAPAAPR